MCGMSQGIGRGEQISLPSSPIPLLAEPSDLQPQLTPPAGAERPARAVEVKVPVKRPPPLPNSAVQTRATGAPDDTIIESKALKASVPPVPPVPPALPAPPQGSSSNVGKLLAFIALLALCGGGFYLWKQPSKQELACNTSISEASMKLAAGNIAAARSVAVDLVSRCEGPVKGQAEELLAALDRQQRASQVECDRKLRGFDSQIANKRMLSARNGLDQLDSICADSPGAKDLRQKLTANQTTASAMETQIRADLSQGRVKEAKAGYDQLGLTNSEYPNLVALNSAISAAVLASQQAEVKLPPVVVEQPVPVQASPVIAPKQPDLTTVFLKDAEQALTQRRFDAARTFVESARRVDPNSAAAASLLRRIKEQELQYLRDETSIK